jgi:hypothetical protein
MVLPLPLPLQLLLDSAVSEPQENDGQVEEQLMELMEQYKEYRTNFAKNIEFDPVLILTDSEADGYYGMSLIVC